MEFGTQPLIQEEIKNAEAIEDTSKKTSFQLSRCQHGSVSYGYVPHGETSVSLGKEAI